MKGLEKEEKSVQKAWWQPAMMMFFRVSTWIAVPVLSATFFGKMIDEKLNSKPFGFIFCVGTAFIISSIGIFKETLSEFNRIEKEEEDKKNKSKISK